MDNWSRNAGMGWVHQSTSPFWLIEGTLKERTPHYGVHMPSRVYDQGLSLGDHPFKWFMGYRSTCFREK